MQARLRSPHVSVLIQVFALETKWSSVHSAFVHFPSLWAVVLVLTKPFSPTHLCAATSQWCPPTPAPPTILWMCVHEIDAHFIYRSFLYFPDTSRIIALVAPLENCQSVVELLRLIGGADPFEMSRSKRTSNLLFIFLHTRSVIGN